MMMMMITRDEEQTPKNTFINRRRTPGVALNPCRIFRQAHLKTAMILTFLLMIVFLQGPRHGPVFVARLGWIRSSLTSNATARLTSSS